MSTGLKYISTLLLCCTVAAGSAFAYRFAVQGSVESATVRLADKPAHIASKLGMSIGILFEQPLGGKDAWNANLGMDLSLRGFKERYGEQQSTLHNLLYLELPLTCSYRIRITKDSLLAILPYAGLYGGLLVGVADSYDSYYADWGSYMHRLDLGIKAGIAFEVDKNVQIAVEQSIGLRSIDERSSIKNSGTRIALRLFF